MYFRFLIFYWLSSQHFQFMLVVFLNFSPVSLYHRLLKLMTDSGYARVPELGSIDFVM